MYALKDMPRHLVFGAYDRATVQSPERPIKTKERDIPLKVSLRPRPSQLPGNSQWTREERKGYSGGKTTGVRDERSMSM